jgi:hypothetical protein
MDNWIRAKHELTYRIRQKAKELEELGEKLDLTKKESWARAEREISEDIRLRAYLRYQATKDHRLDDWLQTEWECNQLPDFNAKVDDLAQEWFQLSGGWIDLEVAREIAKIEFKRKAAYYIWENRCRAEDDWYHAEKTKGISNEINTLAQVIMREAPYLSKEEARYSSKDRLEFKIRERAYYRRGSIAEKAYFLCLKNPNNSEYENWCCAAKEYDNL